MTELEYKKSIEVIRTTAANHGITASQCRQKIQDILDDVWGKNDSESRTLRNQIFPRGKPTPEEFIFHVAKYINNKS